MKRIALVSSEPIRERMAGIGIRYLELARRLPAAAGVETVLISPAPPEESERALAAAAEREEGGAAAGDGEVGAPAAVRRFAAAELPRLLADCDAVVAQGQLANDVLLAGGERPVAVDLYDPWLVENLHYHSVLGLDPYRNDHATWVLQLSRGDLFLCSSEEQRTYYLGWLTALGRVNPERVAADPDLAGLVAVVPFGVPSALPPHRPWLDPPRPGERRVLFGGLYDWYDPWTLLCACERLADDLDWTVLLIANPNPGSTPQRLLGEVEKECRRRGWWGSRVRLLDWVPTARRYDLLRDVDLLAAPHRPSLETRLSLRTRFLDAAAAGLPVAVTEGGAMSRLVAEHGAGWVVPTGDAAALAAALAEALGDSDAAAARRRGAAALAARFAWPRVLAPLAAFCRQPRADATRERYAFRPPTVAPADRLHFKVRRRLARLAARRGR
jgi:glycosyltransferase involved in cell wall biosynthesis